MTVILAVILVAVGATAGWRLARLLRARRRPRRDMEKWAAFCRALERRP